MAKSPFFGTLETRLTAGEGGGGAAERPDPVFRLAIFGDFSGGAAQDLAATRPIEVDRDSFEEVFARLAPSIAVSLGRGDSSVRIEVTDLEHFHPDHLVETLDVFVELRALRRRLLNPASFEQAAAELSGWADPSEAPEEAAAPEVNPPAPVDDLLAASLAATGETAGGAPPGSDPSLAESLISKIVGPYVVPGPDPRQDDLVASVDSAISHQMRAILHDPGFQGLEATWRGLYFLVRRLETGRSLKLSLIDVSKAALSADLLADDELERSVLYKLMVEQTVATPGGLPWSALAGLYSFGPTLADIELLGRIGKIAEAAGIAFLAAAEPGLVGCVSFAETPDPDDWQSTLDAEIEQTWRALRAEPQAAHLGLILPRFLLRMPYGRRGEPVEGFDFEEMTEGQGHEAYLWGNPAVAAAYLIGSGFSAAGWDLRRALSGEIGGLPIHIADVDGEAQAKPCAEILLGERGGNKMIERGLMPLWSVRGSDTVQLMPLGSLSVTQRDLQGPWSP